MKDALKELVEGAHGILAVIILIVITVFVVLGKMTVEQWIEVTKWIIGVFSGTHAAMAIGDNIAERKIAAVIPTATQG